MYEHNEWVGHALKLPTTIIITVGYVLMNYPSILFFGRRRLGFLNTIHVYLFL